MALGHEKLDVIPFSVGYVAWVYEKVATLEGARGATIDRDRMRIVGSDALQRKRLDHVAGRGTAGGRLETPNAILLHARKRLAKRVLDLRIRRH